VGRTVLGVDVGGSSIKHGLIDTGSGALLTALGAVPTPQPGTLDQLVASISDLARYGAPDVPVGVALPSVVRSGVAHTSANLHGSLIGADIRNLLQQRIAQPVVCLNDADAAGLAEVRLGAARGVPGTVMVLTFGTGIGSALFVDGRLVPNTELGHVQMGGRDAEHRASARVKTEENLDWTQWSERVNEYLDLVHGLFWPDLIVIGGGVSASYDQFGPLLRSPAQLRPAKLAAAAGVVGAALAAAR
jgi:polyphosphate glucokinase